MKTIKEPVHHCSWLLKFTSFNPFAPKGLKCNPLSSFQITFCTLKLVSYQEICYVKLLGNCRCCNIKTDRLKDEESIFWCQYKSCRVSNLPKVAANKKAPSLKQWAHEFFQTRVITWGIVQKCFSCSPNSKKKDATLNEKLEIATYRRNNLLNKKKKGYQNAATKTIICFPSMTERTEASCIGKNYYIVTFR